MEKDNNYVHLDLESYDRLKAYERICSTPECVAHYGYGKHMVMLTATDAMKELDKTNAILIDRCHAYVDIINEYEAKKKWYQFWK